jgi:RNA polymerase sigma-70 factor (ECF subfamily)
MSSIEGYTLVLSSAERAGEEVDLAALVETYATTMFRVAHSVVRSREEAEDVVQDAFVRVIEHKSKLGKIRDLRVWLVRIAWNLALDKRRRVRPEQMDEVFVAGLAASAVPVDRVLDETQKMLAVLAEMEWLPKKEREALLLASTEELTAAEMAKVLGRSESAVRALVFRARSRLKQRLDDRLRNRGTYRLGKGGTGR